MILSAVYALHLYREVIFGDVVNEKLEGILDVSKTEVFILGTLAFFTILLGVYPSLITDITSASVEKLIGDFNTAQIAAQAVTGSVN